MIDDILVGFEDAIGEPVISHELPNILDGVQLWRFGWQRQDGDVFGNDEIVGHVPSCLIHDEDGVGTLSDVSGDFDQMLVHGVGIAPRHHEGGGLAVFGAYRPKDIRGACALVVRR